MVFTCTVANTSKKAYAAGKTIYETKGDTTKIYASAFVQNTNDVLSRSNATANFNINIVDGNLAAQDANMIKFHVGTITAKADDYDDLIINLNKNYSEAYLALKVSWGLMGNNTQVLLNSYLQQMQQQK